jgi:hypothetical protein
VDSAYESRVTALEAEGLSRSDAQAVVEAEILAAEFNSGPVPAHLPNLNTGETQQ